MSWTLLRVVFGLKPAAAAALHGLITAPKLALTARAWIYEEQLRELLDGKQINVMRESLQHWCTCVMRSKVEPMKEVAGLVRRHLEGIVAWAQTRQTKRIPRSHQRPVPGRQAPRARLHASVHHQDRHLPDRGQAGLPGDQPARPATYLKFKRSVSYLIISVGGTVARWTAEGTTR